MQDLTGRRAEILQFIRDATGERGFPPTRTGAGQDDLDS